MNIAKLAWVSVAVALLAAGVAIAGAVQDKTVQITEKGYVPEKVDISVGQKVAFQNDTRKDHTVTCLKPAGLSEQDKDTAGFDSGIIPPGTSWAYTFSKVGTYRYYCKEDKLMFGSIVVAPAQ